MKAVTEEFCGKRFSTDTVSRINRKLDRWLKQFASRRLDKEYPYLILDVRYAKVREDGGYGAGRRRRPSESDGRGDAACWLWSWPNGSRRPVGGTSLWG